MPSNIVKTKRDEAAWKKAKAIAAKAHKAGNYRYITAIYKSLSVDPKTLDAVVPTRGTEDIVEAIEELKDCLEHYILDMFVPECACPEGCSCDCNYAWVCVESLTTDTAIVELRGLEDDGTYYSVSYVRDEAGDFYFGVPVEVEEVTTYVPILAPPPVATMSRAVFCEAFPVHAPAAEGLTVGQPVQLLRIGPLHDLDSGDFVLDVTDALCHGIASSASVAGFGIPIDFGHGLYRAQAAGEAQDSIPLYGRITNLDARLGEGLWGTPEWTDTGVALLKQKPGLLYLSPTLMGQPHNPTTGEPMSGRGLHSVSITPTPRQNGLSSLALDRVAKVTTLETQGVQMDKILIYAMAAIHAAHSALGDLTAEDAPLAQNVADTCKALVDANGSAESVMAAVEACKAALVLGDKAPALVAVLTEVLAALAPPPAVEPAPEPAPMAKPVKGNRDMTALLARVKAADEAVFTLAAQLEQKSQEAEALQAKVADYEAKTKERDFNDLCLSHDARGVVIGDGLKATLANLALDQAATILSQMAPSRPQSPLGTAGVPSEPKVRTEEQIISDAHVLMSESKKNGKVLSFAEAVSLSRKVV